MQTGKFMVSPYISICWHLLMLIFGIFSAISCARLLTLKFDRAKAKTFIMPEYLSLSWCLDSRSSDLCHLNNKDWELRESNNQSGSCNKYNQNSYVKIVPAQLSDVHTQDWWDMLKSDLNILSTSLQSSRTAWSHQSTSKKQKDGRLQKF